MTTTVLVVDDHPLFRSGLEGLIATMPDAELVGSLGSAEEALEFARQSSPDVVVMDINLPGMSGVEATRAITASSSHIAVLVLTMVDDDDTVYAAITAGARGYILKGAPAGEISAAIHAVAAGTAVFGAGLAARILVGRPSSPTAIDAPGGELTPRESEILQLIASGNTNNQIARQLGISLKTVQNHVTRVLDKLHATDRTDAALRVRALDRPPTPDR